MLVTLQLHHSLQCKVVHYFESQRENANLWPTVGFGISTTHN